MDFRRIAEQNLKLLRGEKIQINERFGPPNPKKWKKAVEDFYYWFFENNKHGPFFKQLEKPILNRPARDFWKKYFKDDYNPALHMSDPLLYRAQKARFTKDTNPELFTWIKTTHADNMGITVVEVTYYNNGIILMLDNKGVIHQLYVHPDGTTVVIPTDIWGPAHGPEEGGNELPDSIDWEEVYENWIFNHGEDSPFYDPIKGKPHIVPGDGTANPPKFPVIIPALGIPGFGGSDGELPPDWPGSVQPIYTPLPTLPQLPPNLLPINPYDPNINPGLFGG